VLSELWGRHFVRKYKNNNMFEFCMTFAANINIIPEFCIAFARKMSKFYMIIARKICPKNIFLNILQIFFRYGGGGGIALLS